MHEWLEAIDPPAGLRAWGLRFETLDRAFEDCPRAEWRLWLAKYHATTDQEHLRCARAALHVARVALASVPDAPAAAASTLAMAEQWAVTRSLAEGYEAALQALGEGPVPDLVRCAAWFADFEACVGLDGASNVEDLFHDVGLLLRQVRDAAHEASTLARLAADLRVILPTLVLRGG